MSDQEKLPTILPTLSPHTEPAAESLSAEQGPPPADFAQRLASAVPAASGEHLSAAEVTALVGGDESAVDANRNLESAEGADSSDS